MAPWTDWWSRNYFAIRWPWLAAAMARPSVQTAVVSAGILTVFIGIVELRRVFARRVTATTPAPPPAP